ncbi:MAG: prepilin-type N-terminal cleavage/methylation domain-containing protein [Elusimicrobiaceae bacterium]|nr:prepilin-type N-terminal cleavage/methylation domain-containing protein [Elusimicrobiaceae bacterium]
MKKNINNTVALKCLCSGPQPLTKKQRGPEQQPLRTTSSFGFTLIELLVVVLIIGILAAIALPQYQKAVWKSKAVQLQVMAKSLVDAQTAYYLANGTYAEDFSSLDIGFDSLPQHPSTSATNINVSSTDGVRSNDEVELIINSSKGSNNQFDWLYSTAVFKTGPYEKAGFLFSHIPYGITGKIWYCLEHKNVPKGKFCVKLMGTTDSAISTTNYRYYAL